MPGPFLFQLVIVFLTFLLSQTIREIVNFCLKFLMLLTMHEMCIRVFSISKSRFGDVCKTADEYKGIKIKVSTSLSSIL